MVFQPWYNGGMARQWCLARTWEKIMVTGKFVKLGIFAVGLALSGPSMGQITAQSVQSLLAETQANLADAQNMVKLARTPSPPGSSCPDMASHLNPESICNQPGYNPNTNMTSVLHDMDARSPEIAQGMMDKYGYSDVHFDPFLHWAATSKLVNNPITNFITEKTGLNIFFPIYAFGRSLKTTK
jgi:hypothetical protein